MKSMLFAFVLASASLVASEEGFDATIPVLDMNQYTNPATKQQFVDQLSYALREVGFFGVINTGVDQETLDQAYQACFEFFSLPREVKMKSFDLSVNGQRGYVPGESAKGQAVGDYKEFFHVGRELPPSELARYGIAYSNIWPKEYDLQKPLCHLYAALEEYLVPLEEAMAEAIGVERHFLTRMTERGEVLLRALHYPSNPPANLFWAAEHTDIDLFTILPKATAAGLQLLNKQGEWIDVKVPEGAFIVNAGDMLENLTNGEFCSGLHRVVAQNDGTERFSIVYFVHPRSEDRLDPLPLCVERTGGVQKYANATRLELLEERLVDLGLASPVMMSHLAESGLMERLIAVGRASPKAMKKLADAGLASDAVLSEIK